MYPCACVPVHESPLTTACRPVGLKEAAIDSPTSRATIIHFSEQVDLLEKWLEEYIRSTSRLMAESAALEIILNHFTSNAVLPVAISESILDHDYSILAMRRYSESAKDFWMSMVAVAKRMNTLVIEPIRSFLQSDIRAFKDAKRSLEQSQKNFDSLQAKFAALGKTKEPSSLREDAFQLHEARKIYLKASMDFFTLTPQLRFSLDKLIVRIFSDQWREMRAAQENTAATFQRSALDVERVKGWIREMDSSEKAFRKELTTARRQLEDASESNHRPSRELEDYAISTVPRITGLTAGGLPISPKKPVLSSGEKQGWLYLRTYTGKPSRTTWVRRWAFIRNGIFGWLVQSTRAGGVEESERIGVLLCNARPAPMEERRFCFEIKTNKNAIFLQAETQTELASWLTTIEIAKSRAVADPGSSDVLTSPNSLHSNPAFAISPPPVAEFGTNVLTSLEPGASDDSTAIDKAATLSTPSDDPSKGNGDGPKRSAASEREDGSRDHTSRIISKLDLHRKSTASPQLSTSSLPTVNGGIASLIAASHGSMPVGPSLNAEPEQIKPKNMFRQALRDIPPSSLAPSTLASPPAPTNLSRSAVVVTGERGINAVAEKGGIPNGLLANTWGSSNMGSVNRLEHSDRNVLRDGKISGQPSPLMLPTQSPPKGPVPSLSGDIANASMSTPDLSVPHDVLRSRTPSPEKRYRNTISVDGEAARQTRTTISLPEFPQYYPLQLKTQDAQFRLLFTNVRQEERLVLVFRATWNPNNQQDFPGRAYVTTREIYFYSNHLGLVLTSGVSLDLIDEVTAAPGKECDFLFLHMKENGNDTSPARITIKTFLEPLRLLQRRLNFLVRNSIANEPQQLEDVINTLLEMESEVPQRSASMESWEEVAPDTPVDGGAQRHRARVSTLGTEFKTPIRVDGSITGYGHAGPAAQGEKAAKFKLPAQPVLYTPSGNLLLAAEKLFEVSPKALFHVLFGDRSAVWQLLRRERRAQNLKQGPWINIGEGRFRRDFDFDIPLSNSIGHETTTGVRDYQVVDVHNDHLCYIVTDKRTAWHLPYRHDYRLISKIVITHVAKSRCKLAIFVKVEWLQKLWPLQSIIEKYALIDLELDALDLADLVADQVRRLGTHSQTKKAVQIFGQLGQSMEVTQLQSDTFAMTVEIHRAPVQRTALSLMLELMGTTAMGAAGKLLEAVLSFLSWIWKTFSANSVIATLLVLSLLYNSWFSIRDTRDWWHERNAAKFMGRMGVSPNHVMSKSVYLSDLDDIVTPNIGRLKPVDSACYAVFHNSHYLDDLDSGIGQASSGSAQQILRTRQKIGMYRHDLLVAMRVVNSIEREVLRGEWERWVMTENRRCRQLGGMLEQVSNATESGLDQLGSDQEVQQWYDEYCLSCQEEQEKLVTARRLDMEG
jgi:VAD1 Analog of StAR-related lipid transfer domain/BAR domain of APPL family/PH domain